jgi:hypothetical protein
VLTVFVLLGVALLVLGAVSGGHTMRSVAYASELPPHSGAHSPVVQRCGFYSEPVGNEHAVHSLEHGVVWIAFQPELPQAQQELLRELAKQDDTVLVSPYEGLQASIVLTVWGRQITRDSLDALTLEQALTEIRDGPAAPEPGGGCEGPNLWLGGAIGDPE